MISVEQTQTIHLGRTGEQDVTEIVFDIAPWLAQFGQGSVLLNVKRACDTIPYPANIVVVGNTAVWTVSKKDVESYGTGKAELTYMVDDKIKKSVIYKTYTEKSLADVIPTPEDGQTWLDAMTKQVLKAEGHSTQAESYAHGGTGARADENTDNAKYYSEQADLDAQTTDADRQVVEQAKTEVLESAKEVGLYKQAVENVAKDVSDAEVRIGKVEDDVKLMQTDVKSNKDAVDLAKTEITGIQTDVTTKAQQVESDRIKVENAVVDLSKPVREHNVSPTAHQDIRGLIEGLTTRLNALADSDDESLDQLSEIVAYIKSNKTLIENVTTNKVNVADIINNLSTNVPNKPLSASMGVELKRLIDAIKVPTKVSELTNDSGFLTAHQDISGKVDKVTQTQKDAEQDEAIKKNADDVLKCVKKTDIDAEMSDTSENPVQNKAIKQYVDNHSSGGGSVDKKWKLIKDVTIAEPVADINWTTRDDGTSLNEKIVLVNIIVPKESASSETIVEIYGYIDRKGFSFALIKSDTVGRDLYATGIIDISSGRAFSAKANAENYTSNNVNLMTKVELFGLEEATEITRLRARGTIPEGTIIKIYTLE